VAAKDRWIESAFPHAKPGYPAGVNKLDFFSLEIAKGILSNSAVDPLLMNETVLCKRAVKVAKELFKILENSS
jgi:hypothetical protein